MKHRFYLLVFIAGNLLSSAIPAQRYFFDNYNVQNGLSQSQAMGICQDQFNNIWIATLGGISCFNGQSFKSYSKTNGLLNNLALCVLADKKNNIWTGTAEGISKFNGREFVNYPTGKFVTSLVEDCDGTIWGLEDTKLIRMEGEKVRKINIVDGNEIVTGIGRDNSNRIYASVLGKGIFSLINDSWIVKQSLQGLFSNCYIKKVFLIKDRRTVYTCLMMIVF